jgi:hypothetical protein
MCTYASPYMLSKAKITSGGVFFYPAWVWSKGAGCYYSAKLFLSLSLSLYYEIRAKLWPGIGPRQWEFLGRRILIGRFKPAFSSVHPASPSSHRPLSPARRPLPPRLCLPQHTPPQPTHGEADGRNPPARMPRPRPRPRDTDSGARGARY